MSYKWVSLMGELDVQNDVITFTGKSHPRTDGQAGPPILSVGIFICDVEMTDGVVNADVEFLALGDQGLCELIVARDPETQRQAGAGLGGNLFAMYTIREWISPNLLGQPYGQWNTLSSQGDRVNLKPQVKYHLEAKISGSRIVLLADGVEVANATLPNPYARGQVGVFCLGAEDTKVQISDFRVVAESPKAFIVMQFSDPYNQVYSDVIKLACTEFKLNALRADEIYGPGIIIKDVVDQIQRSQVVIADITPPNPNVYFEVGYALALQKPIILLAARATSETKLPFDVSAFRVLFYEDSIGGKAKLEEGLRKHLKEILGGK